jgi:hypothetical protein
MDENGAHWERCLFMIELMAESRTMDENEISWKGKYEEFNYKGFITTLRPKKIKTLKHFYYLLCIFETMYIHWMYCESRTLRKLQNGLMEARKLKLLDNGSK